MSDKTDESQARILIVEDDVFIAADLESSLKSLGHAVCGKATSAEKAIELVEDQQPDLVIMDMVLQGEMDGIDAAKVIRDKWSIPVVFLTAYDDHDRLERAKLVHPLGYILKPFQDRDLRITTEMALYIAKVDAERIQTKQNLEEYKEIVENAEQQMAVVDKNFCYTMVNQAFLKQRDAKYEQVVGKRVEDVLGREVFEKSVKPNLLSCFQGKVVEYEMKCQYPVGQRSLLVRYYPIRNDRNQIDRVAGIITDITEQKRAELELQKREALHKEAQRVAHIGHWELDPEVGAPIWSEEIFHIFDLDPARGEPSFINHEIYLHPDDWPLLNEAVTKGSKDGTPFDLQFRIFRPSGETRWIQAIGAAIRDEKGKVEKLFGTAQDVTERKRIEEALRDSEKRLRHLTSGLLSAQENERKRISLDLHDELGQTLTALQFNLVEIENNLTMDATSTVKEKLKESLSILEEGLEQIHELSLFLRPSILDDLGLAPTLRWYINRFINRANVEVKLEVCDLHERLDQEIETVIYRVVQEALNNVARHAEAKSVMVRLQSKRNSVAVYIEDNGQGFDVNEIFSRDDQETGIGLIGMRERVSLVDGSMTLYSTKGQGTRISIEIPLRRR
ncbi:MAG: response regulator [Thermodesulfobacteriota bacterium]